MSVWWCIQGELMDPVTDDAELQTHFNRHVLTDLTLALLQDSNWYAACAGLPCAPA